MQSCREGQFKCSDGTCIPMTWHCDAEIDCHDGSDEDGEKCRHTVRTFSFSEGLFSHKYFNFLFYSYSILFVCHRHYVPLVICAKISIAFPKRGDVMEKTIVEMVQMKHIVVYNFTVLIIIYFYYFDIFFYFRYSIG